MVLHRYKFVSYPFKTLYHGSPHFFTEFKTYETRFTPCQSIALQYATKNKTHGFLYEYHVSGTHPLSRVLLVPTILTSHEYSAIENKFKRCEKTFDSKQEFESKQGTFKNVSTDWDNFLASFCQFKLIQGIWLPKHENQVMLCRRTVHESLVLKRCVAVPTV